MHFFLSLHVGWCELGFSASEFGFAMIVHLNMFTTSIPEFVELFVMMHVVPQRLHVEHVLQKPSRVA